MPEKQKRYVTIPSDMSKRGRLGEAIQPDFNSGRLNILDAKPKAVFGSRRWVKKSVASRFHQICWE